MDDEALIALVKENPAVYNPSNPQYINRECRAMAREVISKKLDLPMERCKNRWKNVRDQFKKDLVRRPTKGRRYKKMYKYGKMLDFLLPLTNEMEPEPMGKENEAEITPKVEIDDLASNHDNTDKKQSPTLSPIICTQPGVDLISSVPNNDTKNTDVHNSIDAFLIGIGATLKTFSVYHQHIAKGQIFRIVHDLELQELQNNSG